MKPSLFLLITALFKVLQLKLKIGMVFVTSLSFVVMGMAMYLFGGLMVRYFPVDLVGACAILPLVGYLVGFTVSYVLGVEPTSWFVFENKFQFGYLTIDVHEKSDLLKIGL